MVSSFPDGKTHKKAAHGNNQNPARLRDNATRADRGGDAAPGTPPAECETPDGCGGEEYEPLAQPVYSAEASYYDNPRNTKRYVVLKEKVADMQTVEDLILSVMEKVKRGSAVLRHIYVYTPHDPDYGMP